MTIVRVPVVSATDPEDSSGGQFQSGPLAKNVTYSKYPDGRVYATQRPQINISDTIDAASVTSKKARGIVYWEAVATDTLDGRYFVVDDTVYRSGLSNPLGNTISAGEDPVYFVELGEYLIILDPENNEGWYIKSDAANDVEAIADLDFPSNQTPTKNIVGGGVELGGFLFVLTEDGQIWNSNLNDPTAWSSADFISVEREQDIGVFLTKQGDNIVSFSTHSIEFFYNAGNPTGSPLTRRPDLFYRVGAYDRKSFSNTGETVFFIGSEKKGTVTAYMLQGFKPVQIGSELIGQAIFNATARSDLDFIGAGLAINGHVYYFLTSLQRVSVGDRWEAQNTFVFDTLTGLWSLFDTTVADIEAFSIVGSTDRSTGIHKQPFIQFLSGDIGSVVFGTTAVDSSGVDEYVVFAPDGYIENIDDYILNVAQDVTANVMFELNLLPFDGDTMTNKFCHRVSLAGTSNSSTASPDSGINISYSDDHYRSFSTARGLSTAMDRSLFKNGVFKRREWKLEYSGDEILKIEALEMDIRKSRYA